jgi:hypothetical protein
MPLTHLMIYGTKVSDLRPLEGMALELLSASNTPINDVSPLRGMPLTSLRLHDCRQLTDVSALAEAKTLTTLTLPRNAQHFTFLRDFPKIEWLGYGEDKSAGYRITTTAAQFWKDYDANTWLRSLEAAGLKPNKLQRMQDGTWHVDLGNVPIANLEILRGAPISGLQLGNTQIADLNPLRGMALARLAIYNTRVTDLGPLQGMALSHLHMSGTKVKDISVLRGMPLQALKLHACKELSDLSPLAEASNLKELTLPPGAKNVEGLRKLPALERLAYGEIDGRGGPPAQTVAEFWQEYDAKKN